MFFRKSSLVSAQGELLPIKLLEKDAENSADTRPAPVDSSLVGFVDGLESKSESLTVAQLLRDKQRAGYN
jgi:hypothetical protein